MVFFRAFFVLMISLMLNLVGNEKPKVLVLIISSDNFPGSSLDFPYKELQAVWKSYMHLDLDQIEAYFIRGNPDLPTQNELVEDVLWSKTVESVKPGILNKTLLSFEYFEPRLHEFDYILRTNLSSFYVMPKLLSFLKTLPTENCYAASGENFGSGCGYIISSDVAKMILKHKDLLYNNPGDDDVVVGYFLRNQGISLLPAPRADFYRLSDWLNRKDEIPSNIFHFRVKNEYHELRATEDLAIYSDLLKMYYSVN